MYGLHEALASICEEGLTELIRRHQDASNYLQSCLQKIGLKLFIEDPKNRLPSITSVKVPDGVDWMEIIKYAADK